ncbi:hypothetical protein WA026_002078 [Henosepilachna vigintioctopunctata]|uniref:Uncharacterized protein n=1 Tax=Henosepilachna vigintioctopunctata TaxID=420089 RepID=A0AAW1U1B5_9CUCU
MAIFVQLSRPFFNKQPKRDAGYNGSGIQDRITKDKLPQQWTVPNPTETPLLELFGCDCPDVNFNYFFNGFRAMGFVFAFVKSREKDNDSPVESPP